MASDIINISDWLEYFSRFGDAAWDIKHEVNQWLEALGYEFLRIVEDEIIRRKVVDTRLLLNSFQKGAEGNVWTATDGGFSLEVGTNVNYAAFANDGHWTCKKGESGRWVPGVWQGDRFIYTPGAKTGMFLKQKWVEGSHYWESAIRILEKMLPDLLEAKFNGWLAQKFDM